MMRLGPNSWIVRAVMLGAALWGCRESMHPSTEEVDTARTQEQALSEKPAEKPAEPAAKAPDSNSKPAETAERTADGYDVVRAKPQDSAEPAAPNKAPPVFQGPPDSPDPHGGKFTLAEAVKGLPTQGKLTATIRTTLGTLECQMFEDKAPNTVANFVGLARGVRKFWSAKDHAWVARPYYDGTPFHRVIPEFMIQGGDWKGDGSGNMYYTIPDELHPSLKHDRGGLMCMANRGPNTNEAQFFIMEAAAAHLDSSYSIFGECAPLDLVKRIARVPQSGPPNNRPLTPVLMEHVTIERKVPGAKKAAAATPAAPPPSTSAAASTPSEPAKTP